MVDEILTEGDGASVKRTALSVVANQINGLGAPGANQAVRNTAELVETVVRRIRESGGSDLLLGTVTDGQVLKRIGTSITGVASGLTASVFTFTHVSGSVSTGPLGFTPVAAIYVGRVVSFLGTAIVVGIATGTGASAKSVLRSDTVYTDDDAIVVGSTFVDGVPVFAQELDVTEFGASGITLTWSFPAYAHKGYLLVIG